MMIDFHTKNRFSYSSRNVDMNWIQFMQNLMTFTGKKIVDIGCGEGIYSKAFIELGAEKVVGVDFSKEMIAAAKTQNGDSKITYFLRDASATGLNDSCYDVVFSRAVIHHLEDMTPFLRESSRILETRGTIIIQDRTPEDCLLDASAEHLFGYLFEIFPRLRELEIKRRPNRDQVVKSLQEQGFHLVRIFPLWEVRKRYSNFQELSIDIFSRSGHSILHALTDQDLEDFVHYLKGKVLLHDPIIEKDRWTIWVGYKGDLPRS
ncbi:SAM-dependent methyltransferase [Thermoflavimicrobium daqui]|uniref:SAM-dependent methyltransferase n=2 Tax=Thermoflavimicrobium daqui TaxID=2137476 RepID=A0A364K3W4_9BACL|nr:SAM-dependent methyltransferase [Thermoflavimicrobium daqui]